MADEAMEKRKPDFEIRTDLALEERESFPGDGGEIRGVSLREWRENGSDIRMTEVKILDGNGERAMGKPRGTYLTLEADRLRQKDEEYHREAAVQLAGQIRRLLAGMTGRTEWSILTAGLGNSQVTPDALGPEVAGRLRVTRHLEGQYGTGFCRRRGLPVLSGIVPGVMAQTGMETAEILKGIIRETKPDVLIAVDALAARSIRRLGTTIQLTDTGIHPGSGVGNHRHSLTEESLGIPVLAIGVPTVVGAAAIVHDTADAMIRALWDSTAGGGIGGFLQKLDSEEQYDLIRELLEPEFGSLYVTPPDIDETIRLLGQTISDGIHRALF
ncbi:MAG: GPR endopeptidase [Eubacteriales bacterium]|nr:GPR endopeptidase [Eubacteriales bacterium]